MEYYIIAGEASEDLHGANLMKALLDKNPIADFRFWGDDQMAKVGDALVRHYRELAFVGFWEVLTSLRTILKNIDYCKKDVANFKPDVLIFIGYPGFNMRITRWAKQQHIPTHYYISPQIWAWKENRIKAIKQDVDFMYVILFFEKAFYERKHRYPVYSVSHPLLDAIAQHEKVDAETFKNENGLDSRPIMILLPGSRKQEVTKMLKIMLSVIDNYHQYQFVIAGAPSIDYEFYQQLIKKENVHFVGGKTYDLLSVSYAVLVTSNTAILETALLNVPEVVCYRGSWPSYHIAKRIIKLKYISLVNLIVGKPMVTELIQGDPTKKNLEKELDKLSTYAYCYEMFKDYVLLRERLGGEGASEKTAALIVKR